MTLGKGQMSPWIGHQSPGTYTVVIEPFTMSTTFTLCVTISAPIGEKWPGLHVKHKPGNGGKYAILTWCILALHICTVIRAAKSFWVARVDHSIQLFWIKFLEQCRRTCAVTRKRVCFACYDAKYAGNCVAKQKMMVNNWSTFTTG